MRVWIRFGSFEVEGRYAEMWRGNWTMDVAFVVSIKFRWKFHVIFVFNWCNCKTFVSNSKNNRCVKPQSVKPFLVDEQQLDSQWLNEHNSDFPMNWLCESYSATNILLFTERLPRYLKKRSNFITSKFACKTNKKGRKKERRRRRKQPPTKRQSNWNDCYIVCRNLEFVFRPIEFGTRKRKTIFIAICRSCVQVNLARRKKWKSV